MTPPDPLFTINRTTQLSEQVKNGRLAFALTALSIALVTAMTVREFRALFKTNNRTDNFDRDESSRRHR
jgi:hypothetical protein